MTSQERLSEAGFGAVTGPTLAERFARLLPMIRSRARAIGRLDRDDVEQELAAKAWQITVNFASRCNDIELRHLVSRALRHKVIDLFRHAGREPQTVEWFDDHFEAEADE